jgi:hypothetical protein
VGPAECPARYRWQQAPKKKRKKQQDNKSNVEIMEEELGSFV